MTPTVCTWIWNSGFREYLPEHVRVLAAMVKRHLARPHRFVCITDEQGDFGPDVEVMATPPEARALGELKTPEGARFPSCYRRLWMFSEAAKVLGERVLLLDVDLVVTRDLSPIFDRTEPFVGWRPFRDWGAQLRFGGGIYLLTPGARTKVWDDFNGADSIAKARAAGFRGSDQAWISYKLGATEPYFDRQSGIYSIRDFRLSPHLLPDDARLVQMNGPAKPWSREARRLPWVEQHFR